jgi:NADH-quinone oxidoreductase subunit J
MTILHLLFYAFAAVAVFSGLMVVLATNPVRSVLFLVLTFFATAGIWILLHAEFLALILVLVYVGAVMTLFLFVVMMLSTHLESEREGFVRYLPLGAILVASVLAILIFAIGPEHFGLQHFPSPGIKGADYNNLTDLGSVLYTNYVYPFEISAVILLTAIIAAISLAHRRPTGRKSQNVAVQVAVRKQDRIRVLKIPSEKKINPTQAGE